MLVHNNKLIKIQMPAGLSVGYNTANMAYVWDPKKKKKF